MRSGQPSNEINVTHPFLVFGLIDAGLVDLADHFGSEEDFLIKKNIRRAIIYDARAGVQVQLKSDLRGIILC